MGCKQYFFFIESGKGGGVLISMVEPSTPAQKLRLLNFSSLRPAQLTNFDLKKQFEPKPDIYNSGISGGNTDTAVT